MKTKLAAAIVTLVTCASAAHASDGQYNQPVRSNVSLTVGNGGWSTASHPRFVADVNGDGRADFVGLGHSHTYVALSLGDGAFGEPIASDIGMTVDDGWTVADNPRFLADINHDGKADVVGFGGNHVHAALSNGDGTFAAPVRSEIGMTAGNGGWTGSAHPRFLADVDGDGDADIVGFGGSAVHAALSRGDGTFAAPILSTIGMTIGNGGWTVTDHPRLLADVNGDGRADIVGFGNSQVHAALSNGDGTFAAPVLSTIGLTIGNGGWLSSTQPRYLADVNGDGRADIVGFGETLVHAALSNRDGTFAAPVLSAVGMTVHNGDWQVNAHPRDVTDVDGDGKADVVGFGQTHVHVARSNGDGTFSAPVLSRLGINQGDGWRVQDHPRFTADLNGDGRADLVGFGQVEIHGALAWNPAQDYGYLQKPVSGVRPLLTVACTKRGAAPWMRSRSDIQNMLFGPSEPNVNSLMNNMSRGVFKFRNAGVVGPITTETDTFYDCLQSAVSRGLTNLRSFDTNGDRMVTDAELAILFLYDSGPADSHARFGGQSAPNNTCPLAGSDTCFNGLASGATEGGAIDIYAHELLHLVSSFTASDLYGVTCMSSSLSLMSCSGVGSAYHLDPYFKMVLGWEIPRIVYNSSQSGCQMLTAPSASMSGPRTGSLLFPNSSDRKRFLMTEFRNNNPRGGTIFDRDVAGGREGVAIWYVERDISGNLVEDGPNRTDWSIAAPSGSLGGSTLWTAANGEITVGPERVSPVASDAALALRVGPMSDTSPTVDLMWTPRGATTRWQLAGVSEASVARGDVLDLTGVFGVAGDDSVVVLRRRGVTHQLETVQWSCGSVAAVVPDAIERGAYELHILTLSSGALSNALPLTVY